MDPAHLEALRHLMEEVVPFNRHLGMKLVEARVGFAKLEIPFRPELVGDPMRPALHGGLISTLADVAAGAAVWAGLDVTEARVSTIDLRIDYLRPARLETLVAEATVVRRGNRVGVADVKLFHPSAEGDVVATGKGVYNIVLKKA